jgi:hypothetical protein
MTPLATHALKSSRTHVGLSPTNSSTSIDNLQVTLRIPL